MTNTTTTPEVTVSEKAGEKLDKVQAACDMGNEVRVFARTNGIEITIDLVDERLSEIGNPQNPVYDGTHLAECARIANRWTVKRFALNPELTVREAKLGRKAFLAQLGDSEPVAEPVAPPAPEITPRDERRRAIKAAQREIRRASNWDKRHQAEAALKELEAKFEAEDAQQD
jgi:hypothetical protein